MATHPDMFPTLARKQAKDPALATLFSRLCERADAYARLYDEFSTGIVNHREAREGKKFRYKKGQESMLRRFEKEADWAKSEMESSVCKMDDAHLVAVALMGERQLLALDEEMLVGWHEDD